MAQKSVIDEQQKPKPLVQEVVLEYWQHGRIHPDLLRWVTMERWKSVANFLRIVIEKRQPAEIGTLSSRSWKAVFSFTYENFGELGVHYLFLTIILSVAAKRKDEPALHALKDGEVFVMRLGDNCLEVVSTLFQEVQE